jgi:hypothetical protein
VADLERLGIDERDGTGRRHADEQPLVIVVERPVSPWTAQVDLREQVRDTGNAHDRVDHRDRVVTVHHQKEMAVQVDHRPDADDALQVGSDAILAGHRPFAHGFPGFADVHPGGGKASLDGVAGAGIRYTEGHIRPAVGRNLYSAAVRHYRELDVDTLAGDGIGIFLGFGLRVAAATGGEEECSEHDQRRASDQRMGGHHYLSCRCLYVRRYCPAIPV